jgi:hypothetical protein
MAARQIVATSKGRGSHCRQSCRMAVAFSLQLQHINSSLHSVYVHAVLGGDGPRWQPLNGADRHAILVRRQSERVLAGGSGDSGRQLQPNSRGVRPSAGKEPAAATAERHWSFMTLDSKLLLFVFVLFGCIRINVSLQYSVFSLEILVVISHKISLFLYSAFLKCFCVVFILCTALVCVGSLFKTLCVCNYFYLPRPHPNLA